MTDIEIIGALAASGFGDDEIALNLEHGGLLHARHGETFTGRPGTQLCVSDQTVVKLRTELSPRNNAEARSYCFRALAREQELMVHHPQKTWFLFYEGGDRSPAIGNITPRLRPLHDRAGLGPMPDAAYDELICGMIRLYLETAEKHDAGLDISCSNFAIDAQQRLFYVDDDFYAWDEFLALSQFIGVLIRGQEGLTTGRCEALAGCLRNTVAELFRDPIWNNVIAEEVRGLFVPVAKKELVQAFVDTVQDHREAHRRLELPLSAQRPRPAPEPEPAPPTAIAAPTPAPAVASDPAPASEHGPTGAAPRESRLFALLADIHANAPALEAALGYLDRRGIQMGLVAGDVVGYGPHPGACIDLLRGRPELNLVQGNHDHAVVTGHFPTGFSSVAKWVIEWTIGRLTPEQKAFLDEMPLALDGPNWLAVHGAPTDKRYFNAYVYDMTYEENLQDLAARGLDYCFHGHTHLQKIYFKKGDEDGSCVAQRQPLWDYDQALICPGSVGQPRGGKPGAELAVLDLDSWEIELIRLDYDFRRTMADMRTLNFPPNLVERLEAGR